MAPERTTGSSVTRALRVIEAVAAAGDGVTAKAIARRLGCPLPTVYRALGTLVEEGYLVRLNGVRGYGLGYPVAGLHRSLTEQVRPPAPVRAVLREVHEVTRAVAYLAVLRDLDVVVAHVDDCAEHPRPATMHVGEPTAAHALAAGKVLLAGLRPGPLGDVLARTGLPVLAARTLSDRRLLDRELMRIRSDGAAVEVEEYRAGTAGVAAPVRGPGGEVAGAIGVSVGRAEFAARRWELERVVRAAAARCVARGVSVGGPNGYVDDHAWTHPLRRSALITSAACCAHRPCSPPARSTPRGPSTRPGCAPPRTPRSSTSSRCSPRWGWRR